MDPAKAQAIAACGRCGMPEDAHKAAAGDADALGVLAALGGACTQFTASPAAVAYARHLAITDNRPPRRRADGQPGTWLPICKRCGHRGHRKEACPL